MSGSVRASQKPYHQASAIDSRSQRAQRAVTELPAEQTDGESRALDSAGHLLQDSLSSALSSAAGPHAREAGV